MTPLYADPARYRSLREYVRVVRRYALLIAAVTIIGAVAGYISAKRQSPVYDASATVAFRDPTQALSIVGLGASSSQTPAQLAAIAAETMTRPELMSAVKQRLRTSKPAGALAAAIGATVSSNSGLLGITAVGASPGFAADLANAVARELVAQDNRATQAQFSSIASDVRRRIAALGRPRPNSLNSTQLQVYQDELARLATLSSFAQSATIAEVAEADATPVSPHVSRSTIIGLVLGLLLGVTAAFVRDAIDRRLRGGEAIRDSFDLPVIGHVRTQAMGHITQVTGGSARVSSVDRESFRILRRNVELLTRDEPPRVVLVTSPAPAEGKTTVAGSLAFALASAGRRTLLVDLDLRRAELTKSLKISRAPGLTDYLSDQASPRDIVRLQQLGDTGATANSDANGNENGASSQEWLAFIPAGSPSDRAAELLGTERLRRFLSDVATQYDVVVLDSSPLLPVADTLELLPHVDAILMCARSSRTTREQAAAARAVLARYPERPTGVVITGVRSRDAYDAYQNPPRQA